MTDEPKKGFFSFGKKKEARPEPEENPPKGLFARFKKKKDVSSPTAEDQTVARTPTAMAEEETRVADPGDPKPKDKQTGFFSKLKSGLRKTRSSLSGKFSGLFLASRTIDEELLEELEEMLIGSDIGVQTSMEIIEKVRAEVDRSVLKSGSELKAHIQAELLALLTRLPESGLKTGNHPMIMLVVGVNGVGKTTTIGKMARLLREQGKSVVICAADTFRAAAVEQLQIWAKRASVEIVLKEGSKDPGAVVYDALERVKQIDADVLIVDTAGRLHNNPNLMKELEKIRRIVTRSHEDAPHHVLLILDAVTGQNGLQQAKQFVSKVGVTDLAITKLDGTAKGGIAIAIAKELNLPIQFIGVGEQMDDLLPFEPKQFVASLFDA